MDFIFDNGINEIDYDDEYDYYKKINSSNINDFISLKIFQLKIKQIIMN